MLLNEIFTPQFIASTGVTGVILILTVKALQQVYRDMREDSAKREERIMSYLDKKAETDRQVANTLKNLEQGLVELKKCFDQHTHKG
jgi:low affinity Fe/Cu permease